MIVLTLGERCRQNKVKENQSDLKKKINKKKLQVWTSRAVSHP